MTQAALAKMLGMSQTGYSKYETGENDVPTQILIRLADFYGTSVDYLLGRTDKRLNDRISGRFSSYVVSVCSLPPDYRHTRATECARLSVVTKTQEPVAQPRTLHLHCAARAVLQA